jgi:CubicO group peptidase (beta-lactamase class C family)
MKRNSVNILFAALYFTFLAGSANARYNNNYSELVKDCENLIHDKMESDNIIGASALIMVNDSVIWENGFGYADKENKVPMTVNTVVNIASVTKTFTALAIMQLHEKGLLDIDEPLNKYLPAFNPKNRWDNLEKLTIRSVITHTSGIQSDVLKNSDLGSGKYTDVLGFINDTYLLYPPGMVESYSGSGYSILGCLIKEVSKQDYADYIKEHILIPLEMYHSGFIMDSLMNRTRVYSEGERLKEYGFRDIASGGIYTNIIDFAKYARGLMDAYNGMNTTLIGQESIREMFTLHPDNALIESNNKGLGWFMFKNDTAFAVTHAGDCAFGHAEICLIPDKNAAVMILINSAEGEPLRRDFCRTVLNEYGFSTRDIIAPPVIKEVHKEIKSISLSNDILMKHAGDYAQGFSFLTVSISDSNLIMVRDNKYFTLEALSETEFVPYEKTDKDEKVLKDDERYCFVDYGDFHILFHKVRDKESLLGFKLNNFSPSIMNKKLGAYEHFGYQLLVGDTKFKGAELSLSGNRVLMLKLIAYDGEYAFPLDVISNEYATTCGLTAGFGYTIKFTENDKYDIVDFGGITFRKQKYQ